MKATTECNGCGACCDPVMSVHSPTSLQTVSREMLPPEEIAWMLEHLTPIRRGEGVRRAKALGMGHQSDFIVDGEMYLVLTWFYECDLFDSVSRQCTDWEHRPEMCRGYPWYDDEPDDHKNLPEPCSYRADIDQPVYLGPVRR